MSGMITIEEAQASLKELIHKLAPGEEVTITDNEQTCCEVDERAIETAPACARAWEGQRGLHSSGFRRTA